MSLCSSNRHMSLGSLNPNDGTSRHRNISQGPLTPNDDGSRHRNISQGPLTPNDGGSRHRNISQGPLTPNDGGSRHRNISQGPLTPNDGGSRHRNISQASLTPNGGRSMVPVQRTDSEIQNVRSERPEFEAAARTDDPENKFVNGIWQGNVALDELRSDQFSGQRARNFFAITADSITRITGGYLGRGGYGTVWKAWWDGRQVAVKYMESKLESNVEQFLNEVKSLRKLAHPNIVKILGASFDEHFCYVMELMEDGSLDKLLYEKTEVAYTADHVFSWAWQCSSAIDYMHSQPKPFLHRDLKPQNLLMSDNYRVVKICDFGTASLLKTVMSNSIGTAAWMAPEVYVSSSPFFSAYDTKCDVYSFGIILWQMITRKQPYGGFEKYGIVFQVGSMGARPQKIKRIPFVLMNLICSCWDSSPRRRPPMKAVHEIIDVFVKIFPKGGSPLIGGSERNQQNRPLVYIPGCNSSEGTSTSGRTVTLTTTPKTAPVRSESTPWFEQDRPGPSTPTIRTTCPSPPPQPLTRPYLGRKSDTVINASSLSIAALPKRPSDLSLSKSGSTFLGVKRPARTPTEQDVLEGPILRNAKRYLENITRECREAITRKHGLLAMVTMLVEVKFNLLGRKKAWLEETISHYRPLVEEFAVAQERHIRKYGRFPRTIHPVRARFPSVPNDNADPPEDATEAVYDRF